MSFVLSAQQLIAAGIDIIPAEHRELIPRYEMTIKKACLWGSRQAFSVEIFSLRDLGFFERGLYYRRTHLVPTLIL